MSFLRFREYLTIIREDGYANCLIDPTKGYSIVRQRLIEPQAGSSVNAFGDERNPGRINTGIRIKGKIFNHKFYALTDEIVNKYYKISDEVIIGNDFLENHGVIIDYNRHKFYIGGEGGCFNYRHKVREIFKRKLSSGQVITDTVIETDRAILLRKLTLLKNLHEEVNELGEKIINRRRELEYMSVEQSESEEEFRDIIPPYSDSDSE